MKMDNFLSRREFIKKSAEGAAKFFIATNMPWGCDSKKEKGAIKKEEPVEVESHASSSREKIRESLVFEEKGVKVWADEEGIPSRWENSKGQKGDFNKELMLAANQQAIKDFDSYIVQAVRVNNLFEKKEKTVEKKESPIEKLPEDIVSREKLAERKVEILGSDGVDLHIRESAFKEGGLLEQYKSESDRELKIILASSSSLTKESFADKRYDPIRNIVDKEFNSVTEFRKHSKIAIKGEHPNERAFNRQIAEKMTDKECLDWGVFGVKGYALRKGMREENPDTDYLFLAIPKEDLRPENIDILEVATGPSDKKFDIKLRERGLDKVIDSGNPLVLDPEQSYTNPEEYKKLASHGEGSFEWKVLAGVEPETKDPYFVAMHEAEHLRRYSELDSLPEEVDGVENLRYYSEQEVDWTTLENIEKAYEHYEKTGDDSLYPFVLENKEENYFVIG